MVNLGGKDTDREFIYNKVQNAGHEKSAEEPEGSAEKLVVAPHSGKDGPEVLLYLMPRVGMSNASGIVAKTLVEYAKVEHPVVDDEEKHRPFDEGPVKPFHPFLDEGRFVVEVFQ